MDRLAVGARHQIWTLAGAPHIAPRLDPPGKFDACYLTRTAHHTGEIHGHELAWAGDELWVVNTLFSCLCTLNPEFSFVPRWQPPFITALAAEDRCHLNGVAIADGKPAYVTVLGTTDTKGGWREKKATGGCVLEVPSGRVVASGLSMPHSPRVHNGRLWVLDSGTGRILSVDASSGARQGVVDVPGYTRGLSFHDGFAFVGLSKIRETTVFGGVPIAEQRDQLRCGVAIVHLDTNQAVAYLEFKSGVDEIFAVEVLPGVRCPAVSGPFAEADGAGTIWNVPAPKDAPRRHNGDH